MEDTSTGGGFDNVLIEAEDFRNKVLVSVLSGCNYVRSLQGVFIVSEAIYLFAWTAF